MTPWAAEWRQALRRPRLLVLNVAVPLALVAPVAVSSAPAAHKAAVYAVLIAFFGCFGAAIPLVRDAERGLLGRLALAGADPAGLLSARLLASAALDALQLLPSLAVIALASPAGGALLPGLLLASVGGLLVANAAGVAVAALARSLAESALFASVLMLFLLHASGVFRSPAPGSLAERVERLAPLRPLHDALLGSVQATAAAGRPWLESLVLGCVASALVLLLSGPAVRRLASTRAA